MCSFETYLVAYTVTEWDTAKHQQLIKCFQKEKTSKNSFEFHNPDSFSCLDNTGLNLIICFHYSCWSGVWLKEMNDFYLPKSFLKLPG